VALIERNDMVQEIAPTTSGLCSLGLLGPVDPSSQTRSVGSKPRTVYRSPALAVWGDIS
jgi:hypothetical protein